MSGNSVAGTVLLGTTINSVHAVKDGANPFGTLVAGGVFLGVLLAVGEFINDRLAVTLGALYLLSSFLFHGELFLNVLTNLAGTPAPKKA